MFKEGEAQKIKIIIGEIVQIISIDWFFKNTLIYLLHKTLTIK